MFRTGFNRLAASKVLGVREFVGPHPDLLDSNSGLASSYPPLVFILISIIFGCFLVTLVPPMRGPDEAAHFVRAYAIARGEILPTVTDADGRKGALIPRRLQREMQVFELALKHRDEPGFSYDEVFSEYRRVRAELQKESDGERLIFNLYGGSESYPPVPYLVYLPAIAMARVAGLEFLGMLYLMRAAGFVLTTSAIAVAIAFAPSLRWTFLLIAMLPAALYGRAVVSADGTALALAMITATIYLRTAPSSEARPWVRSICLTLGALCKPPQAAFVMLELLKSPFEKNQRTLLVALSALLLPLTWFWFAGTEVSIWRIADRTQFPPEYFSPLWRLRHMLENPSHFPHLLFGSLCSSADYGRQLIGVLGWLDVPLRPFAYPVLGTLLLITACAVGKLDETVRRRLAVFYGFAALGYCLAVFLVFYLVWSPFDAHRVEGVQGRYFLLALPFAAVTFSCLLKQGLALPIRAMAAILGSVISGSATVEAILRVEWRIVL